MEVMVNSHGTGLAAFLEVPSDPRGLIIFAHGSGSGRFSDRNQFVARVLRKQRFATLLIDLLTEEEAADRANVFDIALLADRLTGARDWALAQPGLEDLFVGYFGASTGGGAALRAAAASPDRVDAIVSRGGRPDLAGDSLKSVNVPTLLIVGGEDEVVIDLNRKAMTQLRCDKEMQIIPGATHLFEEPGKLEIVADMAADWFEVHVSHPARASRQGA